MICMNLIELILFKTLFLKMFLKYSSDLSEVAVYLYV